MANPGTSASPWSTLAEVFAAGKTFQPGDRIYLRRGDHGTLTVSGINTGDVFIQAAPGHTPTVRLTLLNAQHWYFKGLSILARVVIDTQTNENSHDNTFENCYLPNGGFAVFSNRITLRGNHIRNGGIHFGYHSNSGLVSGNTIEDFYSDAMNMKGNYNVFEYNLVMNAHKVSGNHNDMFQGWGSKGNVLRGNEFRAYTDPNQPDLASPGLSDVQGIGLFDNWFEDWVIENNHIFVDHAIGIWLLGGKRCKIRNNTVVRCGQNIAIADRPPNIKVSAKK
jgi:parallel beta-helix repeat protein